MTLLQQHVLFCSGSQCCGLWYRNMSPLRDVRIMEYAYQICTSLSRATCTVDFVASTCFGWKPQPSPESYKG